MKDKFIVITPDHPLYPEVLKRMKVPTATSKAELAAAEKIKSMDFDWVALVKDYNEIRSQEILAFLAFGKNYKVKLHQALLRRGLSRHIDYTILVNPVLAPGAVSALGAAPDTQIEEAEFESYACAKGAQYPDPKEHPNLAAMDKAIPRQSNRHVTSDSLPVVRDLCQVYILKMSSKDATNRKKAGRPRRTE